MSDLLSALLPVVRAFKALGVSYRVGGSVASSALGMARTTLDIDVVANIQPRHADALAEKLRGAYYLDPAMMARAAQEQASFNLIHLATMVKIDVFTLTSDPYDQAAFDRKIQQPLTPQTEPLFDMSTPEDVILRKLSWYRMGGQVSERQWTDILGVLRVQRHLDMLYLRQWAPHLQVTALLERALAEA